MLFATSDTPLSVVRLGLLGGTTMLGLVAWVIAGSEGMAPELFSSIGEYAPMGMTALFVVLAIGIWVVRTQRRATGGSPIVGWALAEGMAILGGIYFLLVGDPTFWIFGLAVQLFVSFVLMPISSR